MNNTIFVMFSENIFNDKNIDINKINEQFQVAFQILINKGYKILVAGDGENALNYSKNFVHIFYDENIKAIESIVTEEKYQLIEKNDYLICFSNEDVGLAKLLNKNFVFVDIDAKNADEKDKIKDEFDKFTIENLNAGNIVKIIEEFMHNTKQLQDKNLTEEKDINNEINDNKLKVNSEFENYKIQVKKTIEQLINSNNLDEAKNLIKEYESIVKGDVEIYSFKGIIFLMEKDFDRAENILKEGLSIESDNFDVLYNLGYLYQNKNEINKSIIYYKKSILNTEDKELQNSIYEILKSIGETQKLEDILDEAKFPNVSIIILTYNNLEYNKLCIESIRKYTQEGTYEIIAVDNNSTDGTVEWLKKQQNIKLVLNSENLGFPKGCNQGIKVAEKFNDILLLNNDTVVSPNWLNNLQICLYSNSTIGAVGSVANSCSNLQTIPVTYNNLDEMIDFARNNNISNKSLWEERLRLVGFCILIKNDVIKKIGFLDETFSPGNYEDDDYSFRIRKAGYRLMLCKDSYVHHFGSVSFGEKADEYKKVLIKNRDIFFEKWGFDPNYIIEIRKDITKLIKDENKDNINLLHICSNGGGTLLDIKNNISYANLYGIEPLSQVNVNTDHFADITIGNIEEIDKFNKEYFDFIIITQHQEVEEDIFYILENIKDYIKNSGKAFISVNNEKIKLDKTFKKKLKIQIGNYFYNLIDSNGQQILSMEKILRNNIKITKYNKIDLDIMREDNIFKDISDKSLISILIRRLDNHIESEKNINIISELIKKHIDINNLKDSILKNSINKDNLFNIMGIIYYQQNLYDKSIMLLREAFKINSQNIDTIYNIAFILYKLREYKAALDFLNKIVISDEDIELLNLKSKIEEAT